jgi:hypothetical protein
LWTIKCTNIAKSFNAGTPGGQCRFNAAQTNLGRIPKGLTAVLLTLTAVWFTGTHPRQFFGWT